MYMNIHIHIYLKIKRTKDMNIYFMKQQMWVANKHMKSLTKVLIRKLQIKTMRWYNYWNDRKRKKKIEVEIKREKSEIKMSS